MKKVLLIGALLTAVPAFAFVGRFGGSVSTSDPEILSLRVKNGEASALAVGDVVKMDSTSADGVTVKKTTTQNEIASCVMIEAPAASKFGLCQFYGYHAAVKVHASSNATTAGGKLGVSGQAGRAEGATSSAYVIGEAFEAASTTTTIKAFLML